MEAVITSLLVAVKALANCGKQGGITAVGTPLINLFSLLIGRVTILNFVAI